MEEYPEGFLERYSKTLVKYRELKDAGYRKIFNREKEMTGLEERPIVLTEMVLNGDFYRSMPYITTARYQNGYCMALNLRRMEENNKTNISDVEKMIRKELVLIKKGRYDAKRKGPLARLYEILAKSVRGTRDK